MATVIISLKPYLQEFVKHLFGDELTSRKNVVGSLIQQFVSYSPQGHHHRAPALNNPNHFEIDLKQSHGYETRRGNAWISPQNQLVLERIIYHFFCTQFNTYMDDRTRMLSITTDASIKQLIIQFCIDYGLSPDTTQYDTLKKKWYRHRKKKEEADKLKKKMEKLDDNVSLFCPLIYTKPAYEPLYATQY